MGAEEREKNIPNEVLSGILLSNLSIKSLLRFKSVSKSWRSLITSAEFVQDHLNISKSDPDLAHHRLIGNHYKEESGLSLRSCSLESLLDEPNQNDAVSTYSHPYPTTRDPIYCSVQILGSCNGLLFIKNLSGFSLWNPSTRKLKNVPEPSYSPPQGELGAGKHYYVCGFGYDDSTDDYKVVWVMSYSMQGSKDQEIHQTNIYSVRKNSWKKFENFGKRFQTEYGPGVFVNGKLHWLVAKEGEKEKKYNWNIVSLDLAEGQEKYEIVALPKYHTTFRSSVPKLENLGGYLSLICCSYEYDGKLTDINVWVMKEYDVAESWTIFWSESGLRHRNFRKPIGYFRPFWATENGDIFVLFTKWARKKGEGHGFVQSEMVGVHNGNIEVRKYPLDKYELNDEYYVWESHSVSERTYKPIVYVESLVSP